MKKYAFVALAILSGCAGNPRNIEQSCIDPVNVVGHCYIRKSIDQVTTQDILDTYSHEPWAWKQKLPNVGVALSGGGMKSAPFAMGVLKRLVKEGWLNNVDIISSVSGGGYSAYYLYSKILRFHDQGLSDKNLSDYFIEPRKEAVPLTEMSQSHEKIEFFSEDFGEDFDLGDSDTYCKDFKNHSLRHQRWVGCYQNILSRKPASDSLSNIEKPVSTFLLGGLTTAISLVPHHIANTLFDWKIDLSPSQWVYKNGIERTFGYTPHDKETESKWLYSYTYPEESFADLRRLLDEKEQSAQNTNEKSHIPMWIINATSARSSKLFDLESAPYDLALDQFEITPYGFGSGYYGFVRGNPDDLGINMPQAVLASGAFFSSLQRTLPELRLPLFLFLHTLNLRWGINIPNYNTDNSMRFIHNILPFPLYYLYGFKATKTDATRIQLADGGMNENLGVFPLISRGTRNIIIVSGSADSGGKEMKLDDLCLLASKLGKMGYGIRFKGDPTNSTSTDSYSFDLSERCGGEGALLAKVGYREWRQPVWEGEIYAKTAVDVENPINGIKLWFLQAALDANALNKAQGAILNSDNGQCNKGISVASIEYPCDLLSFWIQEGNGKNDNFPQNNTIYQTAQSSRDLYRAYRSLGFFEAGFLNLLFSHNLVEPASR